MNWTNPFFWTVGISAITFLIVGLLLRRYPPVNINPWYGYRTPASMQSKERWDFAQHHSASVMIRMGVAVMPLAIVSLLMPWGPITSTLIALAVVGGMVAILLIGTERAIRHRFRS